MTTPSETGSPSRLRWPAIAWVTLGAGLAAALILYQPWVARPFDVIDFSEFLPLLSQGASFWDRLHRLVAYYAEAHGRLNLLTYVALAAKWSWLGPSPAAWQTLRFIEMGAICAMALALFRGLGASWGGASLAILLFVVTRSAEEAWVRLTMAEPLGLFLCLIAALIALDFQRTSRWQASAVAIGALLAAAILAKEMLLGVVPFITALALAWSAERGFFFPENSTRNRWLMVSIGAGLLISLLPIALVALKGSHEGFTGSYTVRSASLGRLLGLFQRIMLPTGLRPGPAALLLPANLLFTVVVVSGWVALLHPRDGRARNLTLLGMALSLPLAGAILYSPWPYFNPFYALPFMVGPALLFALALTALGRGTPRARGLAYGAAIAALLFASLTAHREARAAMARQEVNREIAGSLPEFAGVDSIVVAIDYLAPQRWQGFGPTLRRFALATGPATRLPPAGDIPCPEAYRRYAAGPGHVLLISYTSACGALPLATKRIRRYFRYVDWVGRSLAPDSVGADLLVPGQAVAH